MTAVEIEELQEGFTADLEAAEAHARVLMDRACAVDPADQKAWHDAYREWEAATLEVLHARLMLQWLKEEG